VRQTLRSLLVLALVASPALAAPKTRKVVAGARYAASGFHEAMLGHSYRALWTTPVVVEELDLATDASGLKVVKRVGGQETKGLALVGGDGRSYTFRGLDKDPTNILPEELQDTFVRQLVQDQMAAQHPAAPLIVDELSRAAGVPTVPVRLVVMPDDPALGEFRKDFANVVGTFSEYPTAADARNSGFEAATEIIDHMALYEKLAQSPGDRADTREFLRARLFDVLISDFDRHRKQWRWARRPGDSLWHPIPEDRDQAFARYEGLLVRTAAGYVPQLRTFSEHYDAILGLTYNGREQDRWLLPELSHDVWQQTARDLAARITDEVIERAARRMPPEWFALDGARLIAAMKARRDTLPREADVYYRHLAGEVDVQATNAPEEARVARADDGAVDVAVAPLVAAGASGPPYFHRRFLPAETHEVRLYMRGGDDRVRVEGPASGIRLRVIGDGGNDLLDDSSCGCTRFYDSEGEDRVLAPGGATRWDRRPYQQPPGPKAAEWIPPRDWGADTFPVPWLGYGVDTGVFLGGGMTRIGYGFRKQPFASRQTLRAGWATGANQPRVEYDGIFHRANSSTQLGLTARYSGIDILRYYGYGNETSAEGPNDYFKVRHQEALFAPSLSFALAPDLSLTLAPLVRHATTSRGSRLVDLERPYGSGDFGQVGGELRLEYDTRRGLTSGGDLSGPLGRALGYPTRGVRLQANTAGFPALWDVTHAYGWVEGSAATYLSAGQDARATLALRTGGRQMLGGGSGSTRERYPFFDLATLGGGGLFSGTDTIRAYPQNRFIGDRSFYANAELRVYLSQFFVALPGEWGLLVFGDAGRVWLDGETSDTWHTGWGGGIWIALLARTNAVALTVGQSRERTVVSVRAGFSF
jgi:hypothetical protein